MRHEIGIICVVITTIMSQTYAQGMFGGLLKEAKIEETSTKRDNLLLNLVQKVEENEKSEMAKNGQNKMMDSNENNSEPGVGKTSSDSKDNSEIPQRTLSGRPGLDSEERSGRPSRPSGGRPGADSEEGSGRPSRPSGGRPGSDTEEEFGTPSRPSGG